MTITTRSRRATSFSSGHTPAVVGPGTYAPEHALQPTIHPSYSAFASSNKRDLNKNVGTSAITPGPGAYITEVPPSTGGAGGHSSNVFTTKVPRFAPHAPGSTIYLPSTVQENPGPGAYTCPSTLEPTERVTALRPPSHQFSNLLKQGVPTIPRKEQSYGYSTDEDGELHRHSAPASTYSGLGQDTVGPACYNVRKEPAEDITATVASLKSTTKREVWDELSPRIHIPGPGHYNPKNTLLKGEKPSAVFASKVPILPEPKRIQPDEEKALLLALNEQNHPVKQKYRGVKKEQFGSTSGRTDIASNISTPFITPTCNETPGPGTYVDKKTNRFAASHRPHQRPTLRDDGVGFQAVSERPCLAKTKTNNPMGPGAYNPVGQDLTLEKKVRQRQNVGRMGQFGSTTERFLWNMTPESMEPDEQTPGPGTYAPEQPQNNAPPRNGRRPRVYTSSAFRSTTSRFPKSNNNHAPEFHIVGACAAPAVGEYDLINVPQHKVATNPYLNIPFLSQGRRTEVGYETVCLDLPGPGQYEVMSPRDVSLGGHSRTRANAVRSTMATKPRFEKDPTKPHQLLGPGSYAIPSTIGTKSFNVTMKPKTTV
ncbi:putative palmitoyltransferase zdhhc4 [Aphanomyces cochlioides]|nr:putative palmitoyltransferase zdhhc4 [Aphanomyces cochlioides]